MRILVTGSSGHLGEALLRVLRADGHEVIGLDVRAVGVDDRHRIGDRPRRRPGGAASGSRACCTPRRCTSRTWGRTPRQAFVDTNVTGTLTLLEEAVAAGVGRFVFTSTTSAFGRALTPAAGAPATWITEDVPPLPRNIYGATKVAAESLCELVHRDHGLPCLILRTSRFFPEPDDSAEVRGCVLDRERAGERDALPTRRSRRRGGRAPARAGAGAGDRLRPVHRQRNHAVRPVRTWPSCAATHRPLWVGISPMPRPSTPR